MTIFYTDLIEGIAPNQLNGFFVGWPHAPSPNVHLQLLGQSDHRVLAIDAETKNAVGFITAISDNVLSAYIPFLEVLPKYQNQGIGKELLQRMLQKLQSSYMVDLVCDETKISFYEKFSMKKATAMSIRRQERQAGCERALS